MAMIAVATVANAKLRDWMCMRAHSKKDDAMVSDGLLTSAAPNSPPGAGDL
jgi:hypothetical protein